MGAPLDASFGRKARALRTAIDQPARVAGLHVRRHLPLVCVRVAAVAAAEQAAAGCQRLVHRRRPVLFIGLAAEFYFRRFAPESQLRSLTTGVRRRPIFGLQQRIHKVLLKKVAHTRLPSVGFRS